MSNFQHNSTSKGRLNRIVAGIWIVNLICAVLVGLGWLFMSNSSVRAFFISPTQTATATPSPSATFTPSPSWTPSLTPSPTEVLTPTVTDTQTFTPTATQTPVPFSEGPIPIGKSVQGRPLEVFRFGTGSSEKLIVAGMHGGSEFNTIQLADKLIAYLQDHPEIVPADTRLYILRSLNPDGEAREHGPRGRANANGVDLNRNWPANWKKDWPRDGCWTQTYVTGGTKPASEPETVALMKFIQSHKIEAIINYHSAALGIFPGGIPPGKNSKRLAEALAVVTKYPYPPIETGCDYTGAFTDWAGNQGIAAVDIELTNHTNTDFDQNLLALHVFLNWKQ